MSTFMYPLHRKRVLREIREKVKGKERCRVIATSLVEAGVDLDFMVVYREIAGIDSIIQAAGRCNREGRHKKEECKTKFFSFEKSDEFKIPSVLKQPIAVTEQICRKYRDITSLEAIHEYFDKLYHFKGDGLDLKGIVSQFEDGVRSISYPFESIAQSFHIIENQTKTIIIAIEDEAIKLADKMRLGVRSRQLLRDVGNYCVSIYEKDFEALNAAGRLEILDEEFAVLRNVEQYSQEIGLIIDSSRGDAVFY